MAAQNGTLKNNGNDVYPKTLEMNVYDGNGNRLDQKLAQMSSDLANFQTLTAQSPSSVSGSKTTALPTGFNGGNCVIIGAKIELISQFYYSIATLSQNGVDLVLSGTTLYVTTSATTPSNYLGKDIIIALYKHA